MTQNENLTLVILTAVLSGGHVQLIIPAQAIPEDRPATLLQDAGFAGHVPVLVLGSDGFGLPVTMPDWAAEQIKLDGFAQLIAMHPQPVLHAVDAGRLMYVPPPVLG